jgi:predicted O-methyltransferase YrrM
MPHTEPSLGAPGTPAPSTRARVTRARIVQLRHDLEWIWALRGLPVAVVGFQWRARRLARRSGDGFSLESATRPDKLRTILELARGAGRVAELGTATGWTAITLALADPARRVVTFDVVARPVEAYLALVGPDVGARIEFVVAAGSAGPPDPGPYDLLYVDSSHELEQTVAEVRAWQPHLRPGASLVLDDYAHPDYPGVRAAVGRLELSGEHRGGLFIHRRPPHGSPPG